MNTDSFAGFLAGIASGIALGVLFAPKSGVALRRDIADKSQESVDGLMDYATKLMDSAGELVEKERADLLRKQQGLKNAVEAGRRAYQETAG